MKAISVKPVGAAPGGKELVQAFIISDDTPDTLPTTGDGIIGMTADQKFAPFSVIYVIADVDTKVYAADESGTFIAQ